MSNKHNRWLVILLCLNAVLLTAVVSNYVGPEKAYAQQQSRSPQYVLIPGNLRSDEQLVWVIDIANWRLTNCLYNKHSGNIEFSDVIDMAEDFARETVESATGQSETIGPRTLTAPLRQRQ